MQTPSRQLCDNGCNRKALIFVSPGRCGTTRLAEILRKKLPPEEFAVTHQMPFSRLANVVGNLMYYFGQSEKIKEKLYNFIFARYINGRHFITTDPLTAMIIPRKWVESEKVCIIQITRDPEDFAESFYHFSRKNLKSFIAHNFIPLWQINMLPFENLLNSGIKNKYQNIQQQKECFFDTIYAGNSNYIKYDMKRLLETDLLSYIIKFFFHLSIEIRKYELIIKSNQSSYEQ